MGNDISVEKTAVNIGTPAAKINIKPARNCSAKERMKRFLTTDGTRIITDRGHEVSNTSCLEWVSKKKECHMIQYPCLSLPACYRRLAGGSAPSVVEKLSSHTRTSLSVLRERKGISVALSEPERVRRMSATKSKPIRSGCLSAVFDFAQTNCFWIGRSAPIRPPVSQKLKMKLTFGSTRRWAS